MTYRTINPATGEELRAFPDISDAELETAVTRAQAAYQNKWRTLIAWFIFMAIGGLTVFLIAKQPVSNGIAVATLVLLVAGYMVGQVSALGRAARYLETIFLSLTVFLLMVPSVNETLTRVPNGNPIAKGPDSPILLGALGTLVVLLIVGLTAQILHLRRSGNQGRVAVR